MVVSLRVDHLERHGGVSEEVLEPPRRGELLLGVRELCHDRLSLDRVVPEGAFGGGRVQVGDGRGEAIDVHDVERVFDARLQRVRAPAEDPEGLAVPIGGCREESRGARREGGRAPRSIRGSSARATVGTRR